MLLIISLLYKWVKGQLSTFYFLFVLLYFPMVSSTKLSVSSFTSSWCFSSIIAPFVGSIRLFTPKTGLLGSSSSDLAGTGDCEPDFWGNSEHSIFLEAYDKYINLSADCRPSSFLWSSSDIFSSLFWKILSDLSAELILGLCFMPRFSWSSKDFRRSWGVCSFTTMWEEAGWAADWEDD